MFLHVVIPGQEPGKAADLPADYAFPTMQVTTSSQFTAKVIKIILEGKATSRCHRMTPKNLFRFRLNIFGDFL
jgi:hypothetical protein